MTFRTLIAPGVTGGVGIAFTDREGALPTASPYDLARESRWVPALGPTPGRPLWGALGLREIVGVDQVHGDGVLVVDQWLLERPLAEVPRADAAVTTLRGVGLVVRTADCLPVALADPDAGVVAVAHAGRRGLDVGVLTRTVDAMRSLGASQVSAWIGPGICGRCYEVDAALAADFTSRHPHATATTSWGTPALDLTRLAAEEMSACGARVEVLPGCTREDADLFSFRRDGAAAGRQAVIAWLADDSPGAVEVPSAQRVSGGDVTGVRGGSG
ncbi:MAG TPA: polyphenol oxidase family protein [Propionibacteriaceae bacterium]|nr:polyphenol oxidase family protein [Propionibacteriaceae bacterium]